MVSALLPLAAIVQDERSGGASEVAYYPYLVLAVPAYLAPAYPQHPGPYYYLCLQYHLTCQWECAARMPQKLRYDAFVDAGPARRPIYFA